jgi:uncharacterized protein YdiU (UPF0061 family)
MMTEHTEVGGFDFEHSYAQLPEEFFVAYPPDSVVEPELKVLNEPLATELGLDVDWLRSPAGLQVLCGNQTPASAQPLAMAYCGHQFGHFAVLGDGRATLLGEQRTPDGSLWDLQYKGSGRTPFSRGGDGRAVLGPMLREYIISEALHALEIPTTRTLAVVTTGEEVMRQQPGPGALIIRVASSHLRVGTFQYAAARGQQDQKDLLSPLAEYAIARHYPQAAEAEKPFEALLDQVITRQGKLIARWMLNGFIHGVMNTDNMTISGETIDYGPCAFLDAYVPTQVYSSIDRQGRYAYANQPKIGQWNLARLAECFLPLFSADHNESLAIANEYLQRYTAVYQDAWLDGMRAKLGLGDSVEHNDQQLADDLLGIFQVQGTDWTNGFVDLSNSLGQGEAPNQALDNWWHGWQERLKRGGIVPQEAAQQMQRSNPQTIPRNHLVDEALSAAEADNWQPWNDLLPVLRQPFVSPVDAKFTEPAPAAFASCFQTFCGT